MISRLLLVAAAAVPVSTWSQTAQEELEEALPSLDSNLPITLDADFSEFDRKNERLIFRGLRISQGALGIVADEAQASRLDFENSLWVFTGDVVIDSNGTRVFCERAEVTFREYRLYDAVIHGQPARFEQRRSEDGKITEGRAGMMEYDREGGIIRMSDNAWLSDGANEVSGTRISYDLVKEYITADAAGQGQVRMKINPPQKKEPEQ